jgi:hypothetical protein
MMICQGDLPMANSLEEAILEAYHSGAYEVQIVRDVKYVKVPKTPDRYMSGAPMYVQERDRNGN